MKKTWEGINELLYRRKRNFKNITQLKDRGNIVKEASLIPNILNKHFASVGTRLASKLPPSPKHHLIMLANVYLHSHPSLLNKFFLSKFALKYYPHQTRNLMVYIPPPLIYLNSQALL